MLQTGDMAIRKGLEIGNAQEYLRHPAPLVPKNGNRV
jgi:hypothetical protein